MNQVSPPVSTIALPVPWASAQVSYVQWTVCGEQALPVMSELAGPEARKSAFLLRRTSLTASATDEVGTSTTTLTASVSTHCRTMLEPTSGLFWWSADTMVTSMPFAFASKSSTAMLARSEEHTSELQSLMRISY